MSVVERKIGSTLPKISIVTVCHNQARTVADAVRSVQTQDYPFLDYVVVNDGSTDASREIIDQAVDSSTRVIHYEGYRPSPTPILSDLLSSSRGEILGWLSADDLLLPNALATVASVFLDLPNCEWVSGMASTISPQGNLIRSRSVLRNKYDLMTATQAFLQQESTFFARSLWEKSGAQLSEDLLLFDVELWSRFFAHSEPVFVPVPLGAYRKSSGSFTATNYVRVASRVAQIAEEMRKEENFAEQFRASVWRFLSRSRFSVVLSLLGSRVLLLLFPKFSYARATFSLAENRWKLSRVSAFELNVPASA